MTLKNLKIKANNESIQNSNNIPKTTWNIINRNRPKKIAKKEPIKLRINDELIEDTKEVADELNKYYVNLPRSIIQQTNPEFEVIGEKNHKTMFLEPVTPEELLLTMNALKSKPSSGLDELSNIVLKKNGDLIVIPLAHTINLSFSSGIFPECLKTSKVVPLFKKQDKKTS